jgi:mannose/fructose-specific phosphotransferase system component IIA
MVEAAERVVGKLNVNTISVRIGEPRSETESHIEEAVGQLNTDEVLFLTDLEGATPYNLCCRKCGGSSVVLSGMNLPMLFKLATADRLHGALTLAEELRATGLKSIHIRTGNGKQG